MNRRSRCLVLIGSSLVLGSAGTALAAGVAGADIATSARLELAQAHEHGEQGGAEHAPSTPAPPPSAEHGQAPHQPEQADPEQQQMMMPHAPMHEMPGMMGMDHGAAPATGGHDMSPVDVSEAPAAGPQARGGRLLEPTLRNGVKEFELSAGVVRWNILPDLEVGAYAYNGQVPGPLIRVEPQDRIRIRVKNELPDATTVHWHGLVLPIEQDGVPTISQPPIEPGDEHVYEFDVPDTPGTYFYHTHFGADRQQPLGLYGALIINDPAGPLDVASEHVITLGEWTVLISQRDT